MTGDDGTEKNVETPGLSLLQLDQHHRPRIRFVERPSEREYLAVEFWFVCVVLFLCFFSGTSHVHGCERCRCERTSAIPAQ